MKDNAALACLLLCWLPLSATGQPGVIFGQQGFTLRFGAPAVSPELIPEPRDDVLEFADGSALHGQLAGADPEHGLTWIAPVAKNAIHFRPDRIDFIRLARARAVRLAPACHLRLGNGDDLYGSISALDDQSLRFATWFGGDIAIPRAAVRAIAFLSRNYSVVYEGPCDEGGWVVATNSPDGWEFHDDAFISGGPGVLGRELGLTNSATVEFDLSWKSYFNLQVSVYCDAAGRVQANSTPCVLDFNPLHISFRQSQGFGSPFNSAGVPLPEDPARNSLHAAIQCDKALGTVSLFVNNVFTKTWNNCVFHNAGTGIVFQQTPYLPTSTIKLSHLRISQWEGRGEPEISSPATNADAVSFANHDRAGGKIESIRDGKLSLALAGTTLDIPLGRVTEIDFAGAGTASEPPALWQVRAHFPGGGSLSFQLEKWDNKVIAGKSAIFGSLAFQPGAVRELEFNLDRPKEADLATAKEFEELDE